MDFRLEKVDDTAWPLTVKTHMQSMYATVGLCSSTDLLEQFHRYVSVCIRNLPVSVVRMFFHVNFAKSRLFLVKRLLLSV